MEGIEFLLVDPLQISEKGRDGATVMTILASYQGNHMSDDKGTMRQRVRILDHNIGEMAHLPKNRRALQRKIGGGPWEFRYCSRCGGKLTMEECQRCGTPFTLKGSEIIARGHPNIPPKVVKYATSHGHKFVKQPPRP